LTVCEFIKHMVVAKIGLLGKCRQWKSSEK